MGIPPDPRPASDVREVLSRALGLNRMSFSHVRVADVGRDHTHI